MTGHSNRLKTLSKGKSTYSVELGEDKSYPVRGIGSTSIKLENGSNIHFNNILSFPGLHKNLLSISSLEDKGNRVASIDGKVVVWSKDSSIEKAKVIGIREGRLYKLMSPLAQALVHIEISPCELWHRRIAHINYKALLYVSKVVTGLP